MKKLATILTGMVSVIAYGAPAYAGDAGTAEGAYLMVNTGFSQSRDAGEDLNDDVNNTIIVGIGVGYKFGNALRADIGLGYRPNYSVEHAEPFDGYTETADGDVSALTGLASLYYDVDTSSRVTPYVGGGIGFSRNKISNLAIGYETEEGSLTVPVPNETSTSFAWHLSTGIGVSLDENTVADLGYRYIDLGKVESGEIDGVAYGGDLRAHEAQIGLRYHF